MHTPIMHRARWLAKKPTGSAENSMTTAPRKPESPRPVHSNREVRLISNDVEQSLLCALLEEPTYVAPVFKVIRPEEFGIDAHQRIARAIEIVASTPGLVVNRSTVHENLKQTERLQQVGGSAYLIELSNLPAASLDDALSWARILKGLWKKRAALIEIRALAAKFETGSVDDVGAAIKETFERIKQDAEEPSTRVPRTVGDIVADWRDEGQCERLDLGIATLDQLCGGGLPIPRRVLITGAPSAGKTYELVWIAEQFLTRLAAFGFLIGIVAIDEDDTDLLVRFAQMRGFTPGQLEERTEETLAQVETEFADAPVRFYDSEWSLDAAVEDLAAAAKNKGCRSSLFVDSIHVAWSVAGVQARTLRESIDCNFKVLKRAHLVHRMTVITTGEMNRQNYASEKQAADANIAASTAETRAAEFWAQTHLAVRTPKDLDGIVECTVAKNRGIRTKKGKFWLKLLHESHDLQEVGDPNQNPEFVQAKESRKLDTKNRKNLADANQLGQFIVSNPGLSARKLRTAVSAAQSLGWGTGRLDKALAVLRSNQTIYRLVENETSTATTYTVTLEKGAYDTE